MKVVARDERRKESEELIITVEVKVNTQPVAVLTSNISEVVEGGFVTFDVDQSYDPDDRAELEYRFNFGDGVYSDWVREGYTVRLYENVTFTGSNGGTLEENSGEEVLRDKFGAIRVFKLVNGELLEYKDSVVTANGYNYTLPKSSDEMTYTAQLMTREISDTGSDDVLASTWSEPLAVSVYRAVNIPPVANAQAGLLIDNVIIFKDLIDYAKTGDTVTYTADESYDPDGDDALLTYEWRLLDSRGGSINLGANKYEKTFEIIYSLPGTYTAILTVTDEWGGYSTWQVDVIVNELSVPPVSIAGQDITGNPGVPLQFSGAGTDEDGTIVLYEWDFDGDGIFEWSSTENGRELNIYNSGAGTYTATLRVTDNDGNTALDSLTVTVEEVKEETIEEEEETIEEEEEEIEKEEESKLPSISLIPALISIGIIALRRRY
jgi:hypothetical protein